MPLLMHYRTLSGTQISQGSLRCLILDVSFCEKIRAEDYVIAISRPLPKLSLPFLLSLFSFTTSRIKANRAMVWVQVIPRPDSPVSTNSPVMARSPYQAFLKSEGIPNEVPKAQTDILDQSRSQQVDDVPKGSRLGIEIGQSWDLNTS